MREKYLDNHFIGGIANFGWRVGSVHMSGGATINHYSNAHYGKILYVKRGDSKLHARARVLSQS